MIICLIQSTLCRLIMVSLDYSHGQSKLKWLYYNCVYIYNDVTLYLRSNCKEIDKVKQEVYLADSEIGSNALQEQTMELFLWELRVPIISLGAGKASLLRRRICNILFVI